MTSKSSSKKPGKRSATTPPETVEQFLASLQGKSKQEVLALRKIILAANPDIAEGIKWNVPSFRTSEYFATMNLRVKTGIAVILHFGAKKREIPATGVAIADPESLLVWLAKDRAMVTFRDVNDIAARRSAFTNLIREWIKHV
jgi:hypothetical protein